MKKIVIQVIMGSEKCRRKALKIAAGSQGVQSVALEGENRDEVVVIGNGIDSVSLTNKLRKKFNYATILSVIDENVSNENEGGGAGEEEHNDDETTSSLVQNPYFYVNYPPPCPCPTYHVVYDFDSHPSTCSIL